MMYWKAPEKQEEIILKRRRWEGISTQRAEINEWKTIQRIDKNRQLVLLESQQDWETFRQINQKTGGGLNFSNQRWKWRPYNRH